MKKHVKLFEEYIEEGVSDKMLARKGIMSDPDELAELNYQRTQPDMGELIGSFESIKFRDAETKDETKINVYKNPKSLKGFIEGSRGVIMKNGDLYMCDGASIHMPLIKLLWEDKKIITDPDADMFRYHKPVDFLTVQRNGKTNLIAVGESNRMTIELTEISRQYMLAAEKVNPQFDYSFENIVNYQ